MKIIRHVIVFGLLAVLTDGCQFHWLDAIFKRTAGAPSVTADLEKLDLCEQGNGAYRINVLQLPFATYIGDPFTPRFTEYLQNTADKISWLTFVALNWQANKDGTPDSTQCFGQRDALTVWEHWMPGPELFRADNAPPRVWESGTTAKGYPRNSNEAPVFRNFKLTDFDEFNPERKPVPDDQGINTLYEVFYNKKMYDYVMRGNLATVAGQRLFARNWPAQPDGACLTDSITGDTVSMEKWKKRIFMPVGGSKDTIFSYAYSTEMPSSQKRAGRMHYYPNQGAIMIKSAWTILASPERMGRYHTRIVVKDGKRVTLGLVALHIAQKLAEAPRWVWSTFEHVDNAPMVSKQGKALLKPGVDYLYFDELSNDSSTFNKPPGAEQNPKAQIVRLQERTKDRDRMNALFHKMIRKANTNSVWLNYQLVGTQWQFNDPDPLVTEGESKPAILANALMETYHQSTSSCMGCHGKARFLNEKNTHGYFADFVWGLALVDKLKAETPAGHR